ncbi:hypothetical protein PR202_ga12966 [Eleusine coracana subsp. coracana]|uniref:Ergosterol biosynthetic protein 28 n=1 Tax=Eleusine coracana subsp. coracana TaxID=191504 RepID=A0AAV5CDJ2_ELECO|nr:hypothetical protein PR202_ga12964 [Eleusine coracana subsp. coracana]GJM96153.1 hypothetical protein PR202_ga12966 [Eleusine coracana subsp. coracana]
MATMGKRMGGVPALGWWLMVVGTVRLVLTLYGYLDTAALGAATYAKAEMTAVHGRTLGVWTLLSCTLCFLCAFNLDCQPIYWATFLSFVYAYVHFILEYLLYHTASLSDLASLGFVAVTAMVWMLLQWNSHGHARAAKQH